jgi:hypothetical protein
MKIKFLILTGILLINNFLIAQTSTANQKWQGGFNAPGVEGVVWSMATDSPYVYVLGTFTKITGSYKSPRIARFDGSSWSAFPDTVNMPYNGNVIKVNNGVIYVLSDSKVFRWNNSWSVIGDAANYSIFDLDLNGSATFNSLNPDRLVLLINCSNVTGLFINEQIPN